MTIAPQALDRASAHPLYLQIADRIAADIVAGRLAPGEQVESEADLMARHGVSRITVRQALSLLARNGQVVARRGKGTFVAWPALHHDLDALRGFQETLLHHGVEPRTELVAWSASGRVDRTLPPGLDLPVRLARLYSIDDAPFAFVEAWLPAAAGTLGAERAKHLMVYDIVRQYLGLTIARADVVIRCAPAGRERARALGVAGRTNVLVMERTSFATNHAACEFMRIHIVPERYAFRLSLPGPMEIARALHPVASATEASTPRVPAGTPDHRSTRSPR